MLCCAAGTRLSCQSKPSCAGFLHGYAPDCKVCTRHAYGLCVCGRALQGVFAERLHESRCALNIQRVWRGHCGRTWFHYIQQKTSEEKAAALINRVYRYATVCLLCIADVMCEHAPHARAGMHVCIAYLGVTLLLAEASVVDVIVGVRLCAVERLLPRPNGTNCAIRINQN